MTRFHATTSAANGSRGADMVAESQSVGPRATSSASTRRPTRRRHERGDCRGEARIPGWSIGSIQDRANILDKVGIRHPRAQGRDRAAARRAKRGRRCRKASAKPCAPATSSSSSPAKRCGWPARKMPSVRPGVDVEITREPIGVVGLITPWNFPIAIPAWKIAPALAYRQHRRVQAGAVDARLRVGADRDPGERRACRRASSTWCMGSGSVVGETTRQSSATSPRISFTGSVATGRAIAAKAVARMAQVPARDGQQESARRAGRCGPRRLRSTCAVQGAYFSTGQRCTASSRLIVTEGHPRPVCRGADREAADAQGRQRADARNGNRSGRRSSRSSIRTSNTSASASSEGATLATGGERLQRATDGYYLAPALFVDATNAMRISREEIFGPGRLRDPRARTMTRRWRSPTTPRPACRRAS